MNNLYDPKRPNNDMKRLPLELNFKDPELLVQLNKTNIEIARLDEVAKRIPNQKILIEFASIREGVHSNEIENIHTTIEEAFIAELIENQSLIKKEDKETIRYKEAILYGFDKIKNNSIITVNDMVKLNTILLQNDQGIVSSPTKHIAWANGIIYTPPQGIELIHDLLANLEYYYNTFDEKIEIDPLLKLPMLHYQFEAIHPFGDGNGRVGRMLAVLFLVLHKKLELPILFLSEHIIYFKNDYYDLLQAIDENKEGALHKFTFWFLVLVETQALKTMTTILKIENLMLSTKKIIKSHPKLSKIYSHELINYLFTRPFYSVEGLQLTLDIHRHTASTYFRMLEEEGIVKSYKSGRHKYYVNPEFLYELKYGGQK